jgi:hypothetical protein
MQQGDYKLPEERLAMPLVLAATASDAFEDEEVVAGLTE